jgi:hypothetical protein
MTEVCEAIWTELSEELIKTPQTEEEWLKNHRRSCMTGNILLDLLQLTENISG